MVRLALPTVGEAREWDLAAGLRLSLMLGNGKPSNDVLGYSLQGNVRITERQRLGAAPDRAEFDLERPAFGLGIAQPAGTEPIDSKTEQTSFSLWIEPARDADRRWSTFWQLEAAIRDEYHFAAYRLFDLVSTRQQKLGAYNLFGAHLGLDLRF